MYFVGKLIGFRGQTSDRRKALYLSQAVICKVEVIGLGKKKVLTTVRDLQGQSEI